MTEVIRTDTNVVLLMLCYAGDVMTVLVLTVSIVHVVNVTTKYDC